MSVQRWTMQHLVGKVGLTLDADSNGEWVTYSDHARIVAEAQARWVEIARQDRMAAHQRGAQEAERQHAKALADMEQAHAAALAEAALDADTIPANLIDAWIEVGRKAAAPRTLTADDPEPAVGSVALFDGLPYIRQGNKWVAPRANIAYWYEFMRDERPTVLIHDGEDR